MSVNIDNLMTEYADKSNKLNEVYKLINNALYFNDMKSRNFYNLIYEIAKVLDKNDEELGSNYIE